MSAQATQADQADFARALLAAHATPARLSTWNGSDVAQRFSVYRNNVIVSLVDALATAFPVVAELVGEDFFRAMARTFVRAHPPRNPLLATYGGDFPDFIAQFAPARGVSYLADVARLETACLQSFHAADAVPLAADDFAAWTPDALLAARARLHPGVRLLASRAAIVSIRAAHTGAGDLAAVDPSQPEHALVVRPRFDVRVLRIEPAMFAFLQSLERGWSIETALRAAMALEAAFRPQAALALAASEGVFVALEPGEPS